MRVHCLLSGLLLSATLAAAPPPLPEPVRTRLPDNALRLHGDRFTVERPARIPSVFRVLERSVHSNGDVSIRALGPKGQSLRATLGSEGAFGQWREDGHEVLLTTDRDGSWIVELPDTGIVYNACGIGPADAPRGPTPKTSAAAALADTDHVLDLLLVFTRDFRDRYPGGLLQTRFNHYVQITNQVFANSELSVGVRVAGTRRVGYSDLNTNGEALADLANALGGEPIPGLAGLANLRDDLGADLVILFRPHDIERRGSCGVAYYPDNGDDRLGVNVISDGISSWSVCLDDVVAHEIGHNLGAAHQIGAGGGTFDPRGSAFVRPGQFMTVMGSAGTGLPDRFRGLEVFSNPDVLCGGYACGSSFDTDNSAVIRDVVAGVAAYRAPVNGLPDPQELLRAQPDADGDGVVDWLDHFPLDAAEQDDADGDGVGDLADAFPANAAEQRDTDGDGTGDNEDPDDDNDGVEDGEDAFPFDAAEWADADGDGYGDNADAFPGRFSEHLDFDGDGLGDNEDPDDDGDGHPEFDAQGQDLLVVSTGNSRILRYDAATGQPRGIEVPPSDSLLTFQSSLSHRTADDTLVYLGDSGVRRMNLLNRELLGTWVPPYDPDDPNAVQLGTGFPTGIAWLQELGYVAVTRMENPRVALFRGRNRPLAAVALDWQLSVGESPIDVIADGSAGILLGQSTRTLYRADALSTAFLAGPGVAWMQDPRRMALTADRRLLVSDKGRNTVVAVDADSGEFLGDLADLGAAGYAGPSGVAVTRDGVLLVASTADDAILRFDATTGQYLGELVAPRFSGLRAPGAMILVPQLVDRFHADPGRVIRPNAGLWFNPATEGRGFDIEVFGHRLSAIWYTYGEDGLPLWYISVGDLVGFSYQGPLLRFRMHANGSTTFEEVGTLELDFASERSAWMRFEIGAANGEEPLQWLAFDHNPAAEDVTGLWGRADGPGWGLSMATQGDRTVAIAFVFDAAGEPRWVISDTVLGLAPLVFEMSTSFSDTLCPGCQGDPQYRFEPAGAMTLSLPDNAAWDSAIAFPAPLEGDWDLDGLPIVRFSEAPARPR